MEIAFAVPVQLKITEPLCARDNLSKLPVLVFFGTVVKIWVSLAVVKTLMGYYQMPMIIRILKKVSQREIGWGEKMQMILFSPIVNVVALPHFVFKEGWRFFQPYEEAYVEKKFKDLGPF